MVNICSICASKKRHLVDQSIVSGASNRAISSQFPEFSKDTVRRHRPHVSGQIKEVQEAKEIEEVKSLQARIDEIYSLAMESAKAAKSKNDFRAVGACLTPAIKVLDVMSKGPPEDPNPLSTSGKSIDERLDDLAKRRAERKASTDP